MLAPQSKVLNRIRAIDPDIDIKIYEAFANAAKNNSGMPVDKITIPIDELNASLTVTKLRRLPNGNEPLTIREYFRVVFGL